MDQGSFGLVIGLLNDRIEAIRRVAPRTKSGRGEQHQILVAAILDGIEVERDRIASDYEGTADDDERTVLGRTILRLLSQARGLAMLTPYLEDVGRVDLPMGLLQAVDVLIEALLPKGADPVVHLDEHDMYSALNLMHPTARVRQALGVTEHPAQVPIVLFLPSVDPFNALLLPILGHEVGHPAIDELALVSTALERSDVDALNTLLDECMTAADETDATPWQLQLFGWLEELMCDALATVLTGPSLLFASALFLPAPDHGVLGTHPFPCDRTRMTLRLLDELGWRHVISDHAPGITSWLEGLDRPIDATVSRERFLREGVRLLEPGLFTLARERVSNPLAPDAFVGVHSFLEQLLSAGIPPAEISGDPVDPWAAVLAGWIHQIRERGDRPSTLAAAVSDHEFNRSILKAIEMSRTLALWKAP